MRVGEAEAGFSTAVEALLERTGATLDDIRSGIDIQAQAVTALVEQARAGIGRAGVDAAEALGANVNAADSALDKLTAKVAEQDRASQRMVAEIDRALGELDQRFSQLADNGDERAGRFLEALGKSRDELEALGERSEAQQESMDGLAERTQSLQGAIERLSASVRAQLADALEQAAGQTEHLVNSTRSVRPEIDWIRDAAREASDRLETTGSAIADQQDRLAALLGSLDDGVGDAESRLATLAEAISAAQAEAEQLTSTTGPSLVQAMVQVREAASHAAERAKEAIANIVPESAENFSEATREALERVIQESVQERLREVETIAARAVEFSARCGRSADAADARPWAECDSARAACRETAGAKSRSRQRGLRPSRRTSDRFDAFRLDRRRQDPFGRSRRKGLGFLSQGRSRNLHPAGGAADRVQRGQGYSLPI